MRKILFYSFSLVFFIGSANAMILQEERDDPSSPEFLADCSEIECELRSIPSQVDQRRKCTGQGWNQNSHENWNQNLNREWGNYAISNLLNLIDVDTPTSFLHVPTTNSNAAKATSSNWSGYALTGAQNTFSAVSGTWVVPTLQSTPDDSYSAIWVGIDGYSSSTVEQCGTSHNWISGAQQNYAWFEMYPAGSYEIVNFPANPGDTITCSVTYVPLGFNSYYKMVLTNVTRKVTTTIPQSYTRRSNAKRSSAEWIVEAPTIGNSTIAKLSDYQTVTLTKCSATVNGVSSPIGPNGIAITMQSSTTPTIIESVPSVLNQTQNGFTMTWVAE